MLFLSKMGMRQGLLAWMAGTILLTGWNPAALAQTAPGQPGVQPYEQKLAQARNKHNYQRDISAFKRSRKRDLIGLRRDIAAERQALREECRLRQVALRAELDRNGDNRVSRQELLAGRDRIKSVQDSERRQWTELKEKQKQALLALKAEKKKEYREIKDKFRKAGQVSPPVSSDG